MNSRAFGISGAPLRWSASRLACLRFVLAGAVSARSRRKSSPGQRSAPLRPRRQSDPLLKAMREELDRSKPKLKMDNVPRALLHRISPFGRGRVRCRGGIRGAAVRISARMRVSLRVVVRVGDYKQDSYYGPGTGVADFAPLDDDPIALRRQLWLATDQRLQDRRAKPWRRRKRRSANSPPISLSMILRASPPLQSLRAARQTRLRSEAVERMLEKVTDSLSQPIRRSNLFPLLCGSAR